jgi:hypothetical protein
MARVVGFMSTRSAIRPMGKSGRLGRIGLHRATRMIRTNVAPGNLGLGVRWEK